MKLIITSRRGSTAGGLGRYTGGNVFSSIGRQGLKRIINSAVTSTLAQKVANAVVNGAQKVVSTVANGAQKAVGKVAEKQAEQFIEQQIGSIGKKLKRGSTTPPPIVYSPPTKKEKIDINKLIDGAGIVLD